MVSPDLFMRTMSAYMKILLRSWVERGDRL